MTKEEFERIWLRESGTQPGMMLEVIALDNPGFISGKEAA